ncbi:sister chromatid cohesion protein pds5 [Quercus suber]|uniref:Sister chromatid cohesion protein pds5 n=1 Tax=Quercus suber TaxID=58331 RepID=A0AAW0LS72_QUESU
MGQIYTTFTREILRRIDLKENGKSLLHPHSSIDDLLPLNDKVKNLLANVDQAPSKSMQDALLPSMKALVTNELLRHAEMDVKVLVASCITEITRIIAPDTPYDDEQMKEIFQLILAAFKKISHVSICCCTEVSILDTAAKVRSCLVMLDIECDALDVEKFQIF